MSERARAIIRKVPVKQGSAHMRTIKVMGVPDDEPIVERITRGRYKKLTPAMQEAWVKESIQKLKEVMPKADPEGIKKFFSPEKKSASPTAPAAGEPPVEPPEGPGPSGLGSSAGTEAAQKKRSRKMLGFPVTPPGLLDSDRNGINAGIYVDTPPRRSKREVPSYVA